MTTEDGLLTRLAVKIRQGVCALHGHDSLLHFDNGRISLMCFSCGHESPGWEVGGRAARKQTARGTKPRAERRARRLRGRASRRVGAAYSRPKASGVGAAYSERASRSRGFVLNVPSSPVAPAR